jgi:putative tryptophan/tyrosine transport system substrate-binding protein
MSVNRERQNDGAIVDMRARPMRGPGTMILFAVLLLALAGNVASANDVIVVLSQNAVPYAQAEGGLKDQLSTHKINTRTLLLQDAARNPADLYAASAVVAVGTPAAVWLHNNLPAPTPLLYCMVADPTAAGLTTGRTSCGITTDVPLSQQFALIAEALPNARTVGILYRANAPDATRQIQRILDALPRGWQLASVPIDQSSSIADAIDDLTKRHVDVVWTAPDSTIYDTASVRALLLATLRTNTPVFGFSPAFVRAGALVGIGVDPQAQGQQVAGLTLQVLQTPDSKTIQQINPAGKFQIAVNLIVADKLGLQLPQDLVHRATYTFKEEK